MIEKESLHEIFTAAIDCLQVGDTLLKYPEAMKINIRRLSTPKVQQVEVVGLSLVKATASLTVSGMVAELPPTSNWEVGATSIGDKLEREH